MQTAPTPATGTTLTGAPRAHCSFRLVSDFQAGYLKFNGREPRTLEELAVARADYEHRHRRAEIKAMAKKLALLDELLPSLAAHGHKVADRTIYSWDGGKALSIQTGSLSHDDDALYTACIALGFREIERRDYYQKLDHVILKHGRALLVRLQVTKSTREGGVA